MFSYIKSFVSSTAIMAIFMLGSAMAPHEAKAAERSENKNGKPSSVKIIKAQFKDNKKNLDQEKENKESQQSSKKTPQIIKNKSYDAASKIRWNVKAQPLDSEAMLQDNTFITDSDIDSFPFMQYDTEETSYTGNSRSSELERMQFTLTSQIEGHNRESAISLVSGSYAKKQEQNDKSQIVGGQGLAGVSNKATFLHACDKTQQTFNIKKIKF